LDFCRVEKDTVNKIPLPHTVMKGSKSTKENEAGKEMECREKEDLILNS
jgi:hypothetical protein